MSLLRCVRSLISFVSRQPGKTSQNVHVRVIPERALSPKLGVMMFWSSPSNMTLPAISYKRHRFPTETIAYVV